MFSKTNLALEICHCMRCHQLHKVNVQQNSCHQYNAAKIKKMAPSGRNLRGNSFHFQNKCYIYITWLWHTEWPRDVLVKYRRLESPSPNLDLDNVAWINGCLVGFGRSGRDIHCLFIILLASLTIDQSYCLLSKTHPSLNCQWDELFSGCHRCSTSELGNKDRNMNWDNKCLVTEE